MGEIPFTPPEELTRKKEVLLNIPMALPEGITIGDLRTELPNSSQLFVEFKKTGAGTEVAPIVFTYRSVEYRIFPEVKYVVGIGGSEHGMLYLNPLSPTEEVSTESNIPLAADAQFSTAAVRNQIGVEVMVSSPDANVAAAVDHIQGFKQWQHTQAEFQTSLEQLGIATISECIAKSRAKYGLEQIAVGRGMDAMLPGILSYSAGDRFTDARIGGQEHIDVEQLLSEVADEFMGWVKESVLPKVAQIKELMTVDDGIAFGFEEYAFDKSDPSRTSTAVITYLPKVGWSLALPMANCPNQAANAVVNWMRGQISAETFPVMNESINAAIESGKLQLDTDAQVLMYKTLSELRTNYAVFHGDDQIEHAIETLRGMGDPMVGEILFQFRQIIFLDTSEYVKPPSETVHIDFGDDED